eukprot:TRINITY_DN11751_c0_g1_i4.p3 TRINITY_DN11751_c0_g1~~TRINITY_DN11751_c0_g1_i4.p3  ORF type:complete len:294 (+),score=21.75 TRINITY_DN11751_c0_g1_i4:3281-4162(+)
MGFVNKTILQFLVMALLRVQTGIACLCLVVTAIDNGIGKTPPMGWRSWNCYGHNINQSLMEATMDAMVATPHSLNGKPTSLKDLGYNNCGLDDNWQQCGAGIGGSFHDSKGNPIVNQDRFPDMKAMTDHGHSQGLKVGWYGNNCICRESNFPNDLVQAHYQGDVTAAVDFGYDGIKLDGCGEFLNLTLWADLLNKTGRMVMIENCHWGDTVIRLTLCLHTLDPVSLEGRYIQGAIMPGCYDARLLSFDASSARRWLEWRTCICSRRCDRYRLRIGAPLTFIARPATFKPTGAV